LRPNTESTGETYETTLLGVDILLSRVPFGVVYWTGKDDGYTIEVEIGILGAAFRITPPEGSCGVTFFFLIPLPIHEVSIWVSHVSSHCAVSIFGAGRDGDT
jgi:hypothetical protein